MNLDEKRWLERQILSLLDDLLEIASDITLAGPGERARLEVRGRDLVRVLSEKTRELLEGQEEYLLETMRQMIKQKLPGGPIMDTFGPVKEELDRMLEEGIQELPPKAQAEGKDEGLKVEFIIDEEARGKTNLAEEKEQPVSDGLLWEESESILEPYIPERENSLRWVGQPIGEATLFKTADVFRFPWSPESSTPEEPKDFSSSVQESPFERILTLLFPDTPYQKDTFFHGFTFQYYFPSQKLALNIGEENANPRLEYLCRRHGICLITIGEADFHSHYRVKRTLQRKGFSSSKNQVQ